MSDIGPYLPGIFAAYMILLIGSLSPGPSVAMLIGIATNQGRSPALVATLGIALGSMTINILTMLSVGLMLSQAAWAMSVLRVVGAAYLLYLAYGAFSRAIHPSRFQPIDLAPRTPLRYLSMGYLLQITNPKAISFWLAIASIGAVEGATTTVTILFVAGAFLISFVCHGTWAVALSGSTIRVAYIAWRRWIETMLGGFFVLASYKLVTSER